MRRSSCSRRRPQSSVTVLRRRRPSLDRAPRTPGVDCRTSPDLPGKSRHLPRPQNQALRPPGPVLRRLHLPRRRPWPAPDGGRREGGVLPRAVFGATRSSRCRTPAPATPSACRPPPTARPSAYAESSSATAPTPSCTASLTSRWAGSSPGTPRSGAVVPSGCTFKVIPPKLGLSLPGSVCRLHHPQNHCLGGQFRDPTVGAAAASCTIRPSVSSKGSTMGRSNARQRARRSQACPSRPMRRR